MVNTEDDTDDDIDDIDLDHYKDDPRLKIFGNPTIRKTQSFTHKRGTPRAVPQAMVTPSNTPHTSSPTSASPLGTPVGSPKLNPRQMAVALALQQRGLSKSESCSVMEASRTKPRSDSPLVIGFKRMENLSKQQTGQETIHESQITAPESQRAQAETKAVEPETVKSKREERGVSESITIPIRQQGRRPTIVLTSPKEDQGEIFAFYAFSTCPKLIFDCITGLKYLGC